MRIKEQELDLVRVAIEENKVLHAILLQAKRKVIEANVKFEKYKRPENVSHMEKSEKEIYDEVEEMYYNVRAYVAIQFPLYLPVIGDDICVTFCAIPPKKHEKESVKLSYFNEAQESRFSYLLVKIIKHHLTKAIRIGHQSRKVLSAVGDGYNFIWGNVSP